MQFRFHYTSAKEYGQGTNPVSLPTVVVSWYTLKMSETAKKGHIVRSVEEGSIAMEMGIEPGDRIVSINGSPIEDIFDYRFLCADDYIDVIVRDINDEEYLLEIEKDENEDLGIEFDDPLMDEMRHCSNRCIFCLIDQMPKGMRKTLYFKDDDSRLSFLQGNYVTLTNMSDADIERICRFRMEPINVSIHTTDPELRVKMLKNKNAGTSLKKIDKLYESGIHMNGQIVLCKGFNDRAKLERTIKDCSEYLPYLQSLSVVPVGLTKYREGLEKLEPFDKDESAETIDIIEKWQKVIKKKHGINFVYASDEWYIVAGREIPQESAYDGYPQIENGVGMVRSFIDDASSALDVVEVDINAKKRSLLLVTGELVYPYIRDCAKSVTSIHKNVRADVLPIKNNFFGPLITVTGLVTGQDILAQLPDNLSEYDMLCIPENMLRADEDVFLDDMTLTELEEAAGIKAIVVPDGGEAFVRTVIGLDPGERRRRGYEQTDSGDSGSSKRRKIDSF